MSKRTAVLMVLALAAAATTVVLAAGAEAHETRTIELGSMNASGVSGSLTLVDVGRGRTRVDIQVEAAGNPDMPAHVHPGSCAALIPQPKYPLRNVVNGVSSTVVPAPLAELVAGDLAVNVHRSNDDMRTYTACADLR
jgi:hypothetical protein